MATSDPIEVIKEVIKDIESGKFKKDLLNNIDYKKIENELNNKAVSVIDDYYDSYNRRFYKPIGSLYTAYKTYKSGADILIETNDDSLITGNHRVDNSYIFEKMFQEGWHGGANFGNDNMLIPVRSPSKPYDGIRKPWDDHKKNKWIDAEQSDSPAEKINTIVNEYYLNNADLIMNDAIKKIKTKYGL